MSDMPTRGVGKNKKFLLTRLQDMYGDDFHPIMKMAENAVKLQKSADQDPEPVNFKAALDGWEKVAQYVEPKLKAIDINASVDLDGEIHITWQAP
jgi:hypothetical protein